MKLNLKCITQCYVFVPVFIYFYGFIILDVCDLHPFGGFFKDKTNHHNFIYCQIGGGGRRERCPGNLFWCQVTESTGICNWTEQNH